MLLNQHIDLGTQRPGILKMSGTVSALHFFKIKLIQPAYSGEEITVLDTCKQQGDKYSESYHL